MGNSVKAASAGKCSALRYVMEVKKTVFVTFSLSTSLCMHLLNITFALTYVSTDILKNLRLFIVFSAGEKTYA